MPKPLTISPAPFKSSYLAIPPSPFSPRLPLTPPASPPPTSHATKRAPSTPSTPPPSPPLQWLWQCHVCSRAYPLSATRRCLDDGHRFCSGVTLEKTWRIDSSNPRRHRSKRIKHRACQSEFDYTGWRAHNNWRRAEDNYVPTARRDCWNACNFPSECLLAAQQQQKEQQQFCATPLLPSPPEELLPPLNTTTTTPPATTFDAILGGPLSPPSPKEARDRFWDHILDSARQRRRSKDDPAALYRRSPLRLNPVIEDSEMETESEGQMGFEMPASPEAVFGGGPGAAVVLHRLFEAVEWATRAAELQQAGGEEGVRVPERVVVAEFDFGFVGAEEEGWGAGIERDGGKEKRWLGRRR